MRRNPGRFSLNDLSPAHLQPLGGNTCIVGHVLGLERGDPNVPIGEIPTETGHDNTFSHVGAGTEYGQAGSLERFFTGNFRLHCL